MGGVEGGSSFSILGSNLWMVKCPILSLFQRLYPLFQGVEIAESSV